ncbi:MAG: hypothetical protein KC776_05035 [Myxococcales bacterium]|nr:hypothetical protein [Myxococcales bacterium]MCB9580884.1 hypothetical protein [Polyangiaceae bacterium]
MRASSVVLFLFIALAGCASTPSSGGAATAVNPVTEAPGPPTAPTQTSSPCPADISAAEGAACSDEGSACGNGATPGRGLVCRDGIWTEGPMPTPPCCKK